MYAAGAADCRSVLPALVLTWWYSGHISNTLGGGDSRVNKYSYKTEDEFFTRRPVTSCDFPFDVYNNNESVFGFKEGIVPLIKVISVYLHCF